MTAFITTSTLEYCARTSGTHTSDSPLLSHRTAPLWAEETGENRTNSKKSE